MGQNTIIMKVTNKKNTQMRVDYFEGEERERTREESAFHKYMTNKNFFRPYKINEQIRLWQMRKLRI